MFPYMDSEITVTVPGTTIPTSFVRVLTYNDERPTWFSEITGPTSAFAFKEGRTVDQVRVVDIDSVKITTLRSL